MATTTPASADSRLRSAGLKRTPVRLSVLDLLADADTPLAAVQIMSALPADTDSVTVYRTLNTLTDKNLLHRIRGDDRVWRYAVTDTQATTFRHDHAHFVCDSCGNVECLRDIPLPDKLMRQLIPTRQYRVTHSEVLVHGQCPRCAG